MSHRVPFFRSPYNYDTKLVSDETSIPTVGPSLTVQSQSEDADINVLMKRYGITGKFPENPRVPQYGDFTGISDFRSALEAVANANESFMQYPADFRARFDNDPQNFLMFATDPANVPEMKKLGLFNQEVSNGSGSVDSENPKGNTSAGGGAAPGAGGASPVTSGS